MKSFEERLKRLEEISQSIRDGEIPLEKAAELFEEVRKLARLLGLHQDRLQFHQIRAGEGTDLIDKVQNFVDRLAPLKETWPLRRSH